MVNGGGRRAWVEFCREGIGRELSVRAVGGGEK